ncbi:MAG TPA: DUF692 family protein [Anaerolineaceae bacterium]|nr:DUF692 family protein [Anaerolineaceae bacterium]HPN52528.1 DUF692 family protein [Anaerolineaceae bacterium]
MDLAINFSHPTAELLSNRQVDFDYFKCPDWPDMVAEAQRQKPVYVHFPLCAGDDSVGKTDWNRVEHFLSTTATRHVNMHIVSPEDLNPDDPAACEKAVAQVIKDVEVVAARFGKEKVIIENFPMNHTRPYLRPVLEPDAIQHVVRETGCGFLFDLAHARITAHTLQRNVRAYIEGLPMHKMQELHLTGIIWHEGVLTDHLPMQDEDWALVEWLLDNVKTGLWHAPGFVSFEYGGVGEPFAWRNEKSVLARQIPHLRQYFPASTAK